MSVIATGSTERLTWEQIEERYPHQWVGLKDVEFFEDGPDVVSAVVAETGTRNEMMDAYIVDRRLDFAALTMPESCPPGFLPSNWMLWPVADNGSAV